MATHLDTTKRSAAREEERESWFAADFGNLIKTVIINCAIALSFTIIFVSSAFAQEPTAEVHVVAFAVTPFVIDENGSLSGFSIELWNAIAAELNLRTSYQIVSDAEAMEKAMLLKKADLVVMPIAVTLPRVEQFDFSLPILEGGLQIIVRETGETAKPSGPLYDLLDLLISRTTLVWLGIAMLLVLLPAHLVWLLERRHKGGIISSPEYFPGILEAMYWALSCLSTQAETMPRQWIARVLAVLWMFVGVVFVASYTAQLTTTLTVKQIKESISGPQDLPGKVVGTIADSMAVDYLRAHDARVRAFDQPDQMFQALLNKEVVAVVFESPVVRYYAAHAGKGRVRLVGPGFDTGPLAMVFQLDSPLRRRVDIALVTLRHNGTYQQLYNKWFGVL